MCVCVYGGSSFVFKLEKAVILYFVRYLKHMKLRLNKLALVTYSRLKSQHETEYQNQILRALLNLIC